MPFPGFIGTTDANGQFTSSFLLPLGLPSGTTLHYAAAVVNAAKCGNLDCAASLSVTMP